MRRCGAITHTEEYARHKFGRSTRCHDPELYRLEREAREAHRGLWALPEAQRVPPWEWRHHA
jgi:endonuclease YncB( thermonuclease family)